MRYLIALGAIAAIVIVVRSVPKAEDYPDGGWPDIWGDS